MIRAVRRISHWIDRTSARNRSSDGWIYWCSGELCRVSDPSWWLSLYLVIFISQAAVKKIGQKKQSGPKELNIQL